MESTQERGGNIPWNTAHISTIVLLHCHFNISTAGVYPGKGRESTQKRGGHTLERSTHIYNCIAPLPLRCDQLVIKIILYDWR